MIFLIGKHRNSKIAHRYNGCVGGGKPLHNGVEGLPTGYTLCKHCYPPGTKMWEYARKVDQPRNLGQIVAATDYVTGSVHVGAPTAKAAALTRRAIHKTALRQGKVVGVQFWEKDQILKVWRLDT